MSAAPEKISILHDDSPNRGQTSEARYQNVFSSRRIILGHHGITRRAPGMRKKS
jgi:hypothetical protein